MPRISASNISTRAFPLPGGGGDAGLELANSAAYWWSSRSISTGSEQTLPNRNGSGDAQLGSTAGVDTNDPMLLPSSTDPYIWFPGSNNDSNNVDNGASRMNHNINNITYKARFEINTTAGDQGLIGGGSGRLSFFYDQSEDKMKAGVRAVSVTTVSDFSDALGASTGDIIDAKATWNGTNWSFEWAINSTDDADSVTYTDSSTGADQADSLNSLVSSEQFGYGTINLSFNNTESPVKLYYAAISQPGGDTFELWPSALTAQQTINRATTGLQTSLVQGSGRVVFDGSDDYLDLPSAAAPSYTATTGTLTVYVLMIAHTLSDNDRVFSGESAGNNGPSMRIRNTGTKFRMHSGGSLGSTSVDASITVGQLEGGALVIDTGTINGWSTTLGAMTGTGDMTGDGTITHATSPRVGATAYAGGNAPELEVLEVLMFDSALTLADLTALDTYLQRSYV